MKPIDTAAPMVTVFFWNKGADGRRYNVKRYYHPQHWVDQGLDYLAMNPYVAKSKGRPALELSAEDKQLRTRLIMKKAALEQRKLRLKSVGSERLMLEVGIDEQIAGVMTEISSVGGIPKSWIERIVNLV